MGKLEYSSNNSGGGWWLKDEDWLALEEAGWTVEWYRDQTRWDGEPYGERFLDALATNASIETDDPQGAVDAWESIVGMSAYDQGCNCCGRPHNFSYEDDEGNIQLIPEATKR